MSDVTDPGAPAASRADDEVVDITRAELESEVARLRQQVATMEVQAPGRPRHVARRVGTWVLVVLTALAVSLSAVGVWMRERLFDTDAFMATVQPALESPELNDALATRLTDETLDALALEDRIAAALSEVGAGLGDALGDALDLTPTQQARIESLPLPGLEQLAAPIAAGLEARIADRIDTFVDTETFRTQLIALTSAAHTRAVALVREDYDQLPNLVVEQREVRVDLVPVVASILRDLVDQGLEIVGIEEIPVIDVSAEPGASLDRLSDALGVELDPDFGQVTVMSQAELQELQDGARLVDQLVWGLLLATVVLAVLTLVVALDQRRGLIFLAVGSAVGVTLAMPLVRSTEDQIASLGATPEGQEAIGVLADSIFDSLRGVMIWVLVTGLLVALVAHLAGRPPWARRTVAVVREATREKPGGSDVGRFRPEASDLEEARRKESEV